MLKKPTPFSRKLWTNIVISLLKVINEHSFNDYADLNNVYAGKYTGNADPTPLYITELTPYYNNVSPYDNTKLNVDNIRPTSWDHDGPKQNENKDNAKNNDLNNDRRNHDIAGRTPRVNTGPIPNINDDNPTEKNGDNNIPKSWVNDGPALNVKKDNARNMDNDKQNHDTNK